MTVNARFQVASLHAVEVLDSRGRPTLAVTVGLEDGTTARAGVPPRLHRIGGSRRTSRRRPPPIRRKGRPDSRQECEHPSPTP